MFSAMDDSIKFRFITRTLTQDYRVFCDGGKRVLSDAEDFAPIRKMGRIVPEDGPCAVLFMRNGKIFLAVSGMDRGKMDKAGRPIRFSFCRIYQDVNPRSMNLAWGAFKRIIEDWDNAVEEISEERKQPILRISVGEEKDEWQRKNVPVENVNFDEAYFMKWLEGPLGETERPFNTYREGRWSRPKFFDQCLWPDDGYIFKWTKADDIIICQPVGESASQIHHEKQHNSLADVWKATGKIVKTVVEGVVLERAKECSDMDSIGYRTNNLSEELREVINWLTELEEKYQLHSRSTISIFNLIEAAKINLNEAVREAVRLCNETHR